MKGLEVTFNIVFWAVTGWLISTSFSIEGREVEILNGTEFIRIVRNEGLVKQILTLIGISAVAFYGNLYHLSRLDRSRHSFRAALIPLALLTGTYGLFLLIEKFYFSVQFLPLPVSLSLGIALFYFTISVSYGLVKLWIRSERKQQELQLLHKKAELSLLRNQLQPHFLFNALNNLLSMVDQQRSPQLAASIDKLSSLLRYVIEEIRSEKVTVASEIEFVRNYCDLQLLRFEEKEVDLQFRVSGDNGEQPVEPGIFIPFIENAFKYGTEPESRSTIEIVFDIQRSDQVTMTVRNRKFNTLRKNDSTGTGIAATRERLNLVYPGRHQLNIEDGESFTVKLNIQTA